jgi:hypothetical protein
MMVSLLIFQMLSTKNLKQYEPVIRKIFAAGAVSCYYWYRIAALFGFGKFETDTVLINVSAWVPQALITGFCVVLVTFFFWWMVFRKTTGTRWLIRPVFLRQ